MDVTCVSTTLRMQERARHLQNLIKGRGGSVGSASRAIIYSSTSDFLGNPSVLRGAAGQQMSKSPGSIKTTLYDLLTIYQG